MAFTRRFTAFDLPLNGCAVKTRGFDARRDGGTVARMNAKIVLGSLGGAALIHVAVAACSNANAQTAPSVQVVSCNKTFPGPVSPGPGGTSTPIYYAEAAYPGLTTNQLLGHVTNWSTVTKGFQVPPGYGVELQTAVYVRDGFVGAGCEGPGTTTTFAYVP